MKNESTGEIDDSDYFLLNHGDKILSISKDILKSMISELEKNNIKPTTEDLEMVMNVIYHSMFFRR